MKTVRNLLVASLLLLPWCAATIFSQSAAQESEKKVIITKRTVEADGTEITETIIKKGKAAENFDVTQYLRENRADNVKLDVRIQDSEDDDNMVIVKRSQDCGDMAWADELEDHLEHSLAGIANIAGLGGEKHGFLGVTPKENPKGGTEGVTVGIVDDSAAEKAGLQEGDVLLQLDGAKLQEWDDISEFMSKTKPKQKVRVTYLRNNQKNTLDVVLGTSKNAAWDFKFEPKDLKVNVDTREKDACLGVYSAASGEGDSQGAKISDFTSESAAREAELSAGDVITSVNGVRVEGHSELWDEIAKYQPGDKVVVAYLRENQPRQAEATLKACRDNSNKVILNKTDENGEDAQREFFLWNWADQDKKRLQERQVITIRKNTEGDAAQITPVPEGNPSPDRALKLEGFKAYPNPTVGQITVEFRSEPLPTVVSLLDMSGRQLFREELNAFSGDYLQRFDLTDFAKGTVIIHVLQGDKVFTEKIILK